MARRDWEPEFAAYFAARVHVLRRLAYGLCGDWHTADDLVQTAFVRLYRKWPRIRADTVDAYVRRVVVNLFLSHRRGRRREQVVPVPPDGPSATAGAAVAGVADRMVLHRALTGLAPRQRAAVVLRYLEDLPVAEVAGLLGVTEGTVKSQTARALESLRVALRSGASSWE